MIPSARGWCAEVEARAHVLSDALDDELTVTGDDGHHLARVRRLRVGDRITVADGGGSWRPYGIAAIRVRALELRAAGRVVREPVLRPRLVLAFALTKGARPEVAVQKGVELGVDEIVPVRSERAIARWNDDRAAAHVARLARVAREAVGQCRRATLPRVTAPASVAEVARRPGIVVADRDGAAVDPTLLPARDEWTLVVGPEGGFSPAERAELAGAPRIAVGPFVLRAETAAVAGLAALATLRSHEGA